MFYGYRYTGTWNSTFSGKVLARAGVSNAGQADTINQMEGVVASMVGKRLMYRDLVS